MALSLGRYPALLVSLHGTGLYANFDAMAADAGDRAAVREFLTEQQEIQRRLIASLRLDGHLGQSSSDDIASALPGLSAIIAGLAKNASAIQAGATIAERFAGLAAMLFI